MNLTGARWNLQGLKITNPRIQWNLIIGLKHSSFGQPDGATAKIAAFEPYCSLAAQASIWYFKVKGTSKPKAPTIEWLIITNSSLYRSSKQTRFTCISLKKFWVGRFTDFLPFMALGCVRVDNKISRSKTEVAGRVMVLQGLRITNCRIERDSVKMNIILVSQLACFRFYLVPRECRSHCSILTSKRRYSRHITWQELTLPGLRITSSSLRRG